MQHGMGHRGGGIRKRSRRLNSQRTAGRVTPAKTRHMQSRKKLREQRPFFGKQVAVRNDFWWAEYNLKDATWPTDGLKHFKNLSCLSSFKSQEILL